MHNYLIVPTSIIPEYSKNNVPFYDMGRFSNDGTYLLMDDAHPLTTMQKWLGPNFAMYDEFRAMCQSVTAEEFAAMQNDSSSVWYAPPEND
jgi:hypothetical protein